MLFYCPKCNSEDINFKFKNFKEENDLTTWSNIRDGWGIPIRHIICPHCGNVLAGVMILRSNDEDELWYLKETISMYNKERKDGGYIENGKLKWLINDIKNRKGVVK